MNTVSVDREFLEHCLSVMRGVGELCQPIPRKSEDDSTEYCGGQALAELAVCYNKLLETIAYAEQVAIPQAEQPEAGRDGDFSFAYIAGMLDSYAACIHEYAPADDFARWHYVPEIQDAATWLRALRPQAQAAVAYTLRCLHEFARSMRHTAREAEKEQERLRDFAQANWFRGAQSAYSAMLKELDEIAEKQQEVSIGGQIRKIQPPVTIYKQHDGSGKTRIYLEDANSHLCQCETYEDAKGIAEALNGGRGDVR